MSPMGVRIMLGTVTVITPVSSPGLAHVGAQRRVEKCIKNRKRQ